MSTIFFGDKKDFALKLKLDGVEGSPVRKISLGKLTEFSYEALCQEAIALTVSLHEEEESPSFLRADYDVTLKYEDTERDWIFVATTKELVESLKEMVDQGFMRIIADVKPKIPQSTASLPPLVSCTPQSVLAPSTPKKRKKAPKQNKRSVPAITPDSSNAGPIPPRVASMPYASTATASSQEEASHDGKRKARVDYASLDSARVSFEEADLANVAVKQEQEDFTMQDQAEDVMTQEPKKKRARNGALVRDKILQGLGELHALGIEDPLRVYVALMAGYEHIQSKGFSNQVFALKKEGLIEYRQGARIALTQKGVDSLPAVAPPKDNAQAQMRLHTLLKVKKKKEGGKVDLIFEKLCDGQIHDRKTLAMSVGYTHLQSKGFTNALSKLGSLKLIHYPSTSKVRLADIGFPFGRPQVTSDSK